MKQGAETGDPKITCSYTAGLNAFQPETDEPRGVVLNTEHTQIIYIALGSDLNFLDHGPAYRSSGLLVDWLRIAVCMTSLLTWAVECHRSDQYRWRLVSP